MTGRDLAGDARHTSGRLRRAQAELGPVAPTAAEATARTAHAGSVPTRWRRWPTCCTNPWTASSVRPGENAGSDAPRRVPAGVPWPLGEVDQWWTTRAAALCGVCGVPRGRRSERRVPLRVTGADRCRTRFAAGIELGLKGARRRLEKVSDTTMLVVRHPEGTLAQLVVLKVRPGVPPHSE